MRTMHDELWRYGNMIIETDLPDELWIEFKEKMEKNTDQAWTDRHVRSFFQTLLLEYIVSTIDE